MAAAVAAGILRYNEASVFGGDILDHETRCGSSGRVLGATSERPPGRPLRVVGEAQTHLTRKSRDEGWHFPLSVAASRHIY